MRQITSRQNALVASYRAAAHGESPDTVLADGVHLVQDAAAAGLVFRHLMVASEALDSPAVKPLIAQLIARGVEMAVASAAVMAAVSPVRSTSPLTALLERPASANGAVFDVPDPLVVVACDVQDPGNLGAIVRVAEAGSASGVIAAGASSDPFGWKALRGSMGSAFRLPIAREPRLEQAIADARTHRCRTFATVPRGGRSVFDVDLTGPVAVLIGGEGGGLPEHTAISVDDHLTIPMQSPVESLNVAVAAALIVYEARRQRQ